MHAELVAARQRATARRDSRHAGGGRLIVASQGRGEAERTHEWRPSAGGLSGAADAAPRALDILDILAAARQQAAERSRIKRARSASSGEVVRSGSHAKRRREVGTSAAVGAAVAGHGKARAAPGHRASQSTAIVPVAPVAAQRPIVVNFAAEQRYDGASMARVLQQAVQQAVQRAVQQALGPAVAARHAAAAPVVLATRVGDGVGGGARGPAGANALPLAAFPPQGELTGALMQLAPPQKPLLLLTSEGLRQAADQHAAAHPRITHAEGVRRAKAGITVTQDVRHASQVEHETLLLVVLLPPYALAELAGRSLEHILATPPADVVRHVLRMTRRRWVATTIYSWRRAWIRLLLWLEANDIEHDGSVDGMTLGAYLDHVDTAARATCAARPPPPPGSKRKRQTGAYAAEAQWTKLTALRSNWKLRLATEAARARYAPSRSLPAPAVAPTVMALSLLERALVGGRRALEAQLGVAAGPVANALGATLFLAYAVSRVEQAQSCYFDGWQDEFLHGVFLLDKHPCPFKRRPRRFWVPERGLLGDKRWMTALVETLTGYEDVCAVFLENDSPDGNPFNATRVYPAAMAKTRVAVAKRALYAHYVSAEAAAENTLHSERHFIPCVSEAGGEPPEDAVELGRWSGSTAQDADLEPVVRAQQCHRLRLGALPDRYGQVGKVTRVLGIITRQMDRARRAITLRGPALPRVGGWGLIARA